MSEEKPLVAILLCTYNGEQFISKQLASYKAQSYDNWILYVSDDGSTDNTLFLLEQFAKEVTQKIVILKGPKKGFAANFLSLICNPTIVADYYAYSDQDDIWVSQKLEQAVQQLRNEARPALYCGRTAYIDANDLIIGYSNKMERAFTFENALLQSVAGGNTMVINQSCRELLQYYGEQLPICSHDWWTYLLVTLHGGFVYFETKPLVFYRQHKKNLKGMNTKFKGRIARLKMLFEGQFHEWNKSHLSILMQQREVFDGKNRKILLHWYHATNSSFFLNRIYQYSKASVYRQKKVDSFIFFIACIFRRI